MVTTIKNLTLKSIQNTRAEATRKMREDMTQTTRETIDPEVEAGVGVDLSHPITETRVTPKRIRVGITRGTQTEKPIEIKVVMGYTSAMFAHMLTQTVRIVRQLVSGRAQTSSSFGVR